MIGVFYLFSLIAFICGLAYCSAWDTYGVTRSNFDELLAQAQKKSKKGLVLIFIALLYNVIVIIDLCRFHSLWKSHSVSPIFHVDYLDVCDITIVLVIMTAIAAFISLLVYLVKYADIKDKFEREIRISEAETEKQENLRSLMEQKNESDLLEVINKIGRYDKIILISDENSPDKRYQGGVFINVEGKKIYAAGRVIDFDNLISCSYIDDSQVTSKQVGSANATTKTKNGSAVGRAVVGQVLAGPVGAVIGGATAKKETETKINTTTISKTTHNYTVIINVKDILEPVCKISCEQNATAVDEIVGTINAIIQSR